MNASPDRIFCKDRLLAEIPSRRSTGTGTSTPRHQPWAPVHFLLVQAAHRLDGAGLGTELKRLLGRMMTRPAPRLEQGCAAPIRPVASRIIANTGDEGGQSAPPPACDRRVPASLGSVADDFKQP